MASAVERIAAQCGDGSGGYVCFANTHIAVMAREDANFRDVVNGSLLTLPDGKPVYLLGKLKGFSGLEHIPGPDFFQRLIGFEKTPKLRHYFYGGKPEVIECLIDNLKSRFPQADIVGCESPPFRVLTQAEETGVIDRIRTSQPDVVWVGLGAPKQELWMASHWKMLRPALLLGVGAAFDFHAGAVNRAPVLMQKASLEWLYRLSQEPQRLWRRYLYSNAMFLVYSFVDIIRR
jgi:N-acetylglucosaminyldiphosphoundecaprenol N-acetyl-beta-D-mannosaminyltransferase